MAVHAVVLATHQKTFGPDKTVLHIAACLRIFGPGALIHLGDGHAVNNDVSLAGSADPLAGCVN